VISTVFLPLAKKPTEHTRFGKPPCRLVAVRLAAASRLAVAVGLAGAVGLGVAPGLAAARLAAVSHLAAAARLAEGRPAGVARLTQVVPHGTPVARVVAPDRRGPQGLRAVAAEGLVPAGLLRLRDLRLARHPRWPTLACSNCCMQSSWGNISRHS
jgi:hypothetical protein